MTRINASLNPKYFTDEQLLAEHREIKRVPYFLCRALYNSCEQIVLNSIPKQFTLQEGHIKFFYDKQKFLLKRYKLVYKECVRRGFNVTDLTSSWDKVRQLDSRFWNDWEPSMDDNTLVMKRMEFKAYNSKKSCFHYNHAPINLFRVSSLLTDSVTIKPIWDA